MLLFTQYETILGLPLSAVSTSRCITCQDICVQQSHAGSHSVISIKSRLHSEINRYSYSNNRSSPAWGQYIQYCMYAATETNIAVPMWFVFCGMIWCFDYGCSQINWYWYCISKMLPPLWFLAPRLRNPGDGSKYKPRKFMLRIKTYECAYLIWNDIEYWFNYSSSSKFRLQRKH